MESENAGDRVTIHRHLVKARLVQEKRKAASLVTLSAVQVSCGSMDAKIYIHAPSSSNKWFDLECTISLDFLLSM